MIKTLMGTLRFALCLGLFLGAALCPADADTYVRFNTSLGYIDVDLLSSTPNTDANFLSYVNSGAYTNSFFHRTATPTNAGLSAIQGGGYFITSNTIEPITANAPVASEAGVPNTRGTLAMALSTGPDSGTNEWFFNTADNSSILDTTANGGPFTVFGVISNTSSLSVMDQIFNVPIFDESATFGSPFNELPLLNYTAGSNITLSNIVFVNTITPLTVQDFPTWATANFTPTQQSNPNFIAPASIPFKDGIPNLLKYVCDINPSIPMNAAARAKLPTVGITTNNGNKFVTLTYHQYTAMVGVTVNVQTSPDLQTWTTISKPTFVFTGTDSTNDPIYEVVSPLTTTTQFIRLNVSQ